MKSNYNIGLLLFRLCLGGLMLFHGIAKLQSGLDGMLQLVESKGMPGFVAYGVIIGEVVAPILLIIGLRTKLAALIISFTMLMAVYLVHLSDITKLDPQSGSWALELQALYGVGALALFFMGAGKYALSTKSKWD